MTSSSWPSTSIFIPYVELIVPLGKRLSSVSTLTDLILLDFSSLILEFYPDWLIGSRITISNFPVDEDKAHSKNLLLELFR